MSAGQKPLSQDESLSEVYNFRLFLQLELDRRRKNNSKYSLRSFARFLDVEASFLSKMLKGQRSISSHYIQCFAQKLQIPSSEIEKFLAYNSAVIDQSTQFHTLKAKKLSLDTFEVIASWEHYAILELMKLNDFEANVEWIANKLGITLDDAQNAVSRLERVKLLEIDPKGQWRDLSHGYSSHVLGDSITSMAHKAHQQQMLDKASHALNIVPIEQRDQSSILVATSAEKLAEAKEMIRKFRRQLAQFLDNSPEKTTLYNLSISLFPTHNSKEVQL